MPSTHATAYKSGSQRARVVTEFWGEHNLYCPNCSSPKLERQTHNTKAIDFCCPACNFKYQLKGQKTRLGDSVTDGAYGAMMDAIKNDETPNFYFLHYDLATWTIRNLLLIPHFAFPPSAIIKRKPLSATARRAGWIGCNIALNRIPKEARISIIFTAPRSRGRESAPIKSPSSEFVQFVSSPQEVREKFQKIKPLKDLPIKNRGWTLDVLNIIQRLLESRRRGDESLIKTPDRNLRLLTSSPTGTFTNEEIYTHAPELEKLHPDYRHIKDKIRQQLQVLRDLGFLTHLSHGEWRLK